jgi:hypothetical protein
MLNVREELRVGVWKHCMVVLNSLEMSCRCTGNHLRPFWQCWHFGVREGFQKQMYCKMMHNGEHKKLRVMLCGQWHWYLYEAKSVDALLLACEYFTIFCDI